MNSAPVDPARERGFVLVGVVMFVLALTILGLSLYGLSSYEAQFLTQSRASNQAFYQATGGLEMVKAVLAAPPYTLGSAGSVVTHEGIVYAVAMQRNDHGGVDSSGDWRNTDSLVTVIVRTQSGSITRTVTARYQPREQANYYKRLFTSANEIRCYGQDPDAPGPSHFRTTDLNGETWQESGTSLSWADTATWHGTRSTLLRQNIPAPLVTEFLTAKLPFAVLPDTTVIPPSPGDPGQYNLSFRDDPGPGPAFFRTPHQYATEDFDQNFDAASTRFATTDIRVRGVCVWAVPRGVKFERQVTIHRNGGGETATLVIVAGPNGRDLKHPEIGIWFTSGLSVDDDVNLILVSDGQVFFENGLASSQNSRCRNLSVFAGSIRLLGPLAGFQMQLYHDVGEESIDDTVDYLMQYDALPRVPVASDAFTMVPGSWRDLGP